MSLTRIVKEILSKPVWFGRLLEHLVLYMRFFFHSSASLMHFTISSEAFLFVFEHVFPDRTLRIMRSSQEKKNSKENCSSVTLVL